MNIPHYIGFDVHKKHINFCCKRANGELVEEGRLGAERSVLRSWAETRSYAWHGAMEATLFSGWIYDASKPYAMKLEMAHPAMVKAIAAAKKKNDRIDARTIADLLGCNLLPACHVASPEIRELRRLLRYRQLVVRESVRMQNKMAGLLMECGTSFEKEKLHGKKYFSHLLDTLEEVPDSVKDLLRLSRSALEMFQAVQKQLIQKLLVHPELRGRVERLTTIEGIGEITALTWALEIGDPARFSSCAKAMSYCGLTSAFTLLSRQATKRSDFQTAQSLAADGVDQSRQTGAAMESAVGHVACARTGARTLQPRHAGGGAQTRLLSAGRGQKSSALPTSPACERCCRNQLKNRGCEFEFAGDRPAVSRLAGDWATEFLLPMLPSVCFGTGRFTQTQSSWTVPHCRSRK